MPRLARSVTDRPVISSPSRSILPEVGVTIPAIILASVDLPPPFGPVITTKLSSIFKLMFLIISFSPPSESALKEMFSSSNIASSV